MAEFSNDRLGILHGITMDDEAPRPSRSSRSSNEKSSRSSRYKSSSSKTSSSKAETTSTPASASTSAEKTTENDGRSSDKKTKFRFKKKSHRERRENTTSQTSSSAPKRHKTYHTSIDLDDDPSLYDDSYIPNSAAWQRAANPDAAFLESLFDAMADDEGAQFWEGVYGQPIHEYERPMKKDERGGLERMTDEEYAEYVRERMWERSYEFVEQERRRREQDRTKRKEREREEQEEWEREERERRQEERRRRERKERDRFKDAWRDYLRHWESGSSKVEDIPWPVASGRVKDVVREKVEEFMLAAPGEEEITDVLKRERVRWHPDKAQQRWGLDALTKTEMEAITMVFQTVDALWAEYKGKGKSS
jgi:phosphoglycolate phosphatase-like HAD superfamily hydrolase